MVEFAHAVQQKLNQYKADDATMGEVNKMKRIKKNLISKFSRVLIKVNQFYFYLIVVLMLFHHYFMN
jgi:hypothetical protein